MSQMEQNRAPCVPYKKINFTHFISLVYASSSASSSSAVGCFFWLLKLRPPPRPGKESQLICWIFSQSMIFHVKIEEFCNFQLYLPLLGRPFAPLGLRDCWNLRSPPPPAVNLLKGEVGISEVMI